MIENLASYYEGPQGLRTLFYKFNGGPVKGKRGPAVIYGYYLVTLVHYLNIDVSSIAHPTFILNVR